MTTHTHATPVRSNRLQSGTNFLGIIVAAAGWFGGALWDPGQSPGAKTFYAIGQHTVVFFIKSSVQIVYQSIQERRGFTDFDCRNDQNLQFRTVQGAN